MFLTHSDEALEIEKFKRSRENKIKFAYDYGNLNASNVNEKIILEDDYFQDIINPDFEKIDSSFQQTSLLKPYVLSVILEKIIIDLEDEVCDKEENPKVIVPGTFKLSVSQSVSIMSMSKTSCDSKNVEIKFKRKRRKRKSSKQNVKQVDNDVSRANNDFVPFSNLDTFSSVRRPKNNSVIWKKKGSFNTSNVGFSAVSVSNLNKNVKRYSRKDLMNDLLDDNKFFIFDDVNVRISPVSKMPFRKKPRNSMHVRSKSNSNKSLPITVHKWLPKLQPLAELVAKWFPRIVQIFLWIIDSGCSKHMTGNRALLTNFVEKFLRTVRFRNNDFAMIVGYGDVVIGSIMIKKVYYVEGLGHNLFSVGQFYNKGLEFAFRKSTCFARNEDGVDLLTERHNKMVSWKGGIEAARTMLSFLNLPLFLRAEAIATTCFTQNRSIIHKRFDKTPYELINKRKPNIKFFRVFGCRCYLLNDYEDIGKLKANGDIGVFVGYSKESAAFRVYNK
nr:integrase, catalytic region, zinc finger, CCHC-type, peptidase aspartic, catalytic [Tanacetum cinerariifolium]